MKKLSITILTFLILQNVSAQQNRNLLADGYPFSVIKKNLINDHSWVTYPDYKDRDGWNKLPENIRDEYIKNGEEYLNYNWQYIPASLYLEFTRSGSRAVMQKPYRENIVALEGLVMAELMEGKGRFINDIVDGVFYYCEQTYWGLSAHLSLQKIGSGLPDAADPTIDLGVGKVAANLAWIHYFFKEQFEEIHPLINKRLKSEIYEKVLNPYYERVDFWWMGYTGSMVNNWNPWCNYNVLNCIALLEDDPSTRAINVQKTMRSVDQFINYYKEDGGCEEGPGYWSHAGGKLFDYLELLNKISGGQLSVYEQPVVQNMGKYIYRAYIDGEYFINFADASAKIHSRPGVIYRYGKRINDPLMSGFGAYLAKEHHFGEESITGKIELALENLFSMGEIKTVKPIAPRLKEFNLEKTQIMGARDNTGNSDGFYFAAKGGHNAESHNHNDVGSFILYYDGKPALIDVGVGTYTAKTFSSKRYEIWTMQSGYHNLPAINGMEQKNGAEYKAGETNFSSTSSKVSYSVDIKGAYPAEAQVNSWNRAYTLYRGKKFIISDKYSLSKNIGDTKLNFMTDLACKVVKPGVIELKGEEFTLQMKYNSSALEPVIQKKEIEDGRLERAWGKEVYRLILKFKNAGLSGSNQIEVVKL